MYCISLIPGGGLGTRLVDVLYWPHSRGRPGNETGGCTVLASFPGEAWERDWWMYCIGLIPGGGLGTRLVDVLYKPHSRGRPGNETGGCTVLASFPGEAWERDWWMYCINLIPGGGLGTRLVDVLACSCKAWCSSMVGMSPR